MANSRSGKSNPAKKSAARAPAKGKSASRGNSKKQPQKPVSRRAQRRQERSSVMGSIPLAGLGLLMVAMVLVPGQSAWSIVRGCLFGVFGVVTYFVGPLLLYMAYLLASGYYIRKFAAKTLLLALMTASVPVVFSEFRIGDSTFVQVVKMLFTWGQTHFWAGGVFGGAVGAGLLALCGRPAANILMILLFLVGVMVFFAVTPLDVVQFSAYQLQKHRQAQAARAEEATAYDTRLFNQQPEEEPIENLTDTLPAKPGRRAFDVEPYLEKDKNAAAGAVPPAAAGSAAPRTPSVPPRADFDVDLGPNTADLALKKALEHDPLAPVVIGPGGTFGLDPLEQVNRRRPAPAPDPVSEAPVQPEENFELQLTPAPVQPAAETAAPAAPGPAADELTSADPDLTALIRKAMGTAGGEPDAVPGETVLELPEEEPDFATPLTPAAAPEVLPEPQAAAAAPAAIPTLGGSFDVASAAWNAGIPMTEILAGQVPVPMPGAQPARTAQPAQPPQTVQPAPAQPAPAPTMGNSAAEPIYSPPSAAKAAPALNTQPAEPAKPYCYPSVNLFNPQRAEDDAGAAREMKKNADILVNTLDSFGVSTKILDICRGPSVTRYELQPQAGVKISRITNLADDIALNLATAGVRIEAPIPGKPAVGIEVPNRIRSSVSIRGVFESQNYINMRSPLTMALGKDIAGTAQVADLCKMPHLLIAGSTGSGKSVCVNSIIISFLFRSGPEDVKLILIDPKVVELAEYNGIPHLLMPVVTEPRKAAGALGASVAEMERRYKLFAENNVRDIKTYNKLAAQNSVLEHLPYIAIVIDELADLMMVAGKEVEDYICRIAQKARAAGIHLIIATQRPSVDVITGLIKANIPSRVAFAVSSQIDSRTILDSGGAEKLLGNGDMLFMPVGAAKPTRIQGTFVTDEEISAVLNFIKTTSTSQYDEEMIAEMERRAVADKHSAADSDDDGADSGLDAMFDQAVECVIDAGQASTSLLQRRCKLGYARAARIMDQMEQEKIIGPYEGAKPRAVLVSRSQWQERKLSADDGD